MTARPELKVNPIACDGRGLCAEAAPELIVLDDWGFPIIRPGGVPRSLEADALEAARLCPKLALHLASEPPRPARRRRSKLVQNDWGVDRRRKS